MGNKSITVDGSQHYRCQKSEGSVYVLFPAALGVRAKGTIISQRYWTQAALKSGWALLLTGGRA